MYDFLLDNLSQSDINTIEIMLETGNNPIELLSQLALNNTQTSLVFNSMACDCNQALSLIL